MSLVLELLTSHTTIIQHYRIPCFLEILEATSYTEGSTGCHDGSGANAETKGVEAAPGDLFFHSGVSAVHCGSDAVLQAAALTPKRLTLPKFVSK
jgi:hypothetical protein